QRTNRSFKPSVRKSLGRAMSRSEAYRMIRRRAIDAGVFAPVCCHSFGATGITVYLENLQRSFMIGRQMQFPLCQSRPWKPFKRTRIMSQKKSAAHIVNSDDANVALQQSEQEFEALVSGVEDYAIFLLGPEGNVISWNAGAQRIKGYKPKEIIGKHFSVF